MKYESYFPSDADGQYRMPEGGIANFYFIEDKYLDDDNTELEDFFTYGVPEGVGSMRHIGKGLARYGRYGDDTIAHVETGEMIVPLEIQKQNPELVSRIREALEDYGVEADRYVVGSDANSINPITGQPEFGLKKFFKKVGKALKKLAKPIITIGLTLIGVPPIIAGGIGGTVGGLVQGESLKTALKSGVKGALIAGVTAGVTGGLKSIGNPDVSFGQGFTSGIRDGLGNTLGNTLMPNTPTMSERILAAKNPGMTFEQARAASTSYNNSLSEIKAQGLSPSASSTAKELALQDAVKSSGYVSPTSLPLNEQILNSPAAAAEFTRLSNLNTQLGTNLTTDQLMTKALENAGATTASNIAGSTFLDKIGGLKGIATTAAIALPTIGALTGAFNPPPQEDVVEEYGYPELTDQEIADAGPGVPTDEEYVSTLTPSAGAGQPTNTPYQSTLTPSAGIGQPGSNYQFVSYPGTTVGPQPNFNPDLMGSFNNSIYYPSQYQTIPGYNPQITGMSPAPFYGYDQYGRPIYSYYGTPDVRQANFDPYAGPAQQEFVTPEQMVVPQELPPQEIQTAAVGGPMTRDNFPRRSGMIQGPGTETSDDIPAMLSDGEFVMTARAVRGAGNGDRNAGFRKMYEIMRAFEGGAVRA